MQSFSDVTRPQTSVPKSLPYMELITHEHSGTPAHGYARPVDSETSSGSDEKDTVTLGRRRSVLLPMNAGISSLFIRSCLQGLVYLPGAEGALLGRTRSPSPPLRENEVSRGKSGIATEAAAARAQDKKLGNEKDRRVDEENEREDRASILSSAADETTEGEDATSDSLEHPPHPSTRNRLQEEQGNQDPQPLAEADSQSAPSDTPTPQRATDFTRKDFFTPTQSSSTTPATARTSSTTAAAAAAAAVAAASTSSTGPHSTSQADEPPRESQTKDTDAASLSSALGASGSKALRGGIRCQWGQHVDTEASQIFKAYWFTNKETFLRSFESGDDDDDDDDEMGGDSNGEQDAKDVAEEDPGLAAARFEGLDSMDTPSVARMVAATRAAGAAVNHPAPHIIDDAVLFEAGMNPTHVRQLIANARMKRKRRGQTRLPLNNELCEPRLLTSSSAASSVCSDDVDAEEEEEVVNGQTLLYRCDYEAVAPTGNLKRSEAPSSANTHDNHGVEHDDGSRFHNYASNSSGRMPALMLNPIDPVSLEEVSQYMVLRAVLGPDCEGDLLVCDGLLGDPHALQDRAVDSEEVTALSQDAVARQDAAMRIMAAASFLQL